MHRILSHLFAWLVAVSAFAADPTATAYSFSDCQGSAKPYPVPTRAIEVPDSLTPVMINHVGRHGARFAASPSHISRLRKALEDATRRGTITPLGKRLTETVVTIENATASRWGQLDSLGAAEQRGIAARMYASFPELFAGKSVNAISSYVPRCVMSMYEFTHQLAQLDKKIELTDASGRRFSTLMRFFSDNPEDLRQIRASRNRDQAIHRLTHPNVAPASRIRQKLSPVSRFRRDRHGRIFRSRRHGSHRAHLSGKRLFLSSGIQHTMVHLQPPAISTGRQPRCRPFLPTLPHRCSPT